MKSYTITVNGNVYDVTVEENGAVSAPAAAPRRAAAPAPAAAPAKEAAQPAAVEEETVDEGELVAAITAAICAYTGSSSDGFVVRSIRRADSAKWKRA